MVNFSDKILHLKATKSFSLSPEALQEFTELKAEIAESSLHATDKNYPFVVECNASEVDIELRRLTCRIHVMHSPR